MGQRGSEARPEEVLTPESPRPFLPKRWVVERTFSWLGQNRRMSKDYERLPESSEVLIYAAMSRLMARRWLTHESFQTVSSRSSENAIRPKFVAGSDREATPGLRGTGRFTTGDPGSAVAPAVRTVEPQRLQPSALAIRVRREEPRSGWRSGRRPHAEPGRYPAFGRIARVGVPLLPLSFSLPTWVLLLPRNDHRARRVTGV